MEGSIEIKRGMQKYVKEGAVVELVLFIIFSAILTYAGSIDNVIEHEYGAFLLSAVIAVPVTMFIVAVYYMINWDNSLIY